MRRYYKIRSDTGWWNKEIGWCTDMYSGTLFTEHDVLTLRLPIGLNVRWTCVVFDKDGIGSLLEDWEYFS